MEASLPAAGAGRRRDVVAAIAERWREIRPDLDPAPMLVIGRLGRIAVLVDQFLRPPFAAAGIANGDFDLLAALRRQGPPHELSPGALAETMLVTTGATTKRIDRLEKQGYVTRRSSDSDGRARIVALRRRGRTLVDGLMPVHLANEAALIAPLSPARRRQLAGLLGELVAAVEQQTGVRRTSQ